jgi:hypothetical protein
LRKGQGDLYQLQPSSVALSYISTLLFSSAPILVASLPQSLLSFTVKPYSWASKYKLTRSLRGRPLLRRHCGQPSCFLEVCKDWSRLWTVKSQRPASLQLPLPPPSCSSSLHPLPTHRKSLASQSRAFTLGKEVSTRILQKVLKFRASRSHFYAQITPKLYFGQETLSWSLIPNCSKWRVQSSP